MNVLVKHREIESTLQKKKVHHHKSSYFSICTKNGSFTLSLIIYIIHLFKCGWWLSHPDKNQGSSGKMEAATTMANLGAVEWLQSTLNQTTAHGVARQGPNHSWVFKSICQNVQGGYMWLQMLQIILMSTPNKPRGCGKWECHFRKSSDLVVGTP